MVAAELSIPYQTWFGNEFFEGMPKTAAWLEGIIKTPEFIKRFGVIKRAAVAEEEDDDIEVDDLFGDDDAPVEKVQVKKKEKKKAVAMSLVMLEVKPLDD